MTIQEKRLITLLSVLLAVLFGAVLIILSARYRSAQRAQAQQAAQQEAAQQETPRLEYVNFSYFTPSAYLAFALDTAGAWYWENEPDFPLDDTRLETIQTLFRDLSPTETLPLPEDLSEYGLDQPIAQITAVTAAEETIQVSLGEAAEDGSGRYALLSRDPRHLFIVPETLYDSLQTPIYQMCRLPRLPELKETAISSIYLESPPQGEDETPRITVLTAAQGEGITTWRTGGANVTASASLSALLEDLARLELAACVDYHPSDEAAALCGFDAPTVLTVRHRTAAGEEAFTLTIGNRDLTDAGRYVRIGEEAAIYLMDSSLLDPLMRLAYNGMEEPDAGADSAPGGQE